MKFLTNSKLSEHQYETPEGYLVCVDSIIARCGKQTYRKNELFTDSDDDSEIEVDRPYDEVFNPTTIASFENQPLVNEHPDEDVNISNYKDLSVGFVRDVREDKEKGQPVLKANIIVTDPDTIDDIKSKRKTDLSCGYDCSILKDDKGGYYQSGIRGNHVALCEQGRAGNARIVDSEKIRDGGFQEIGIYWKNLERKNPDVVKYLKEFYRTPVYQNWDLKNSMDIIYSQQLFDEFRNYYKQRTKKELIVDSIKDDENSIIDDLIADELDAIEGYKKAMKNADEEDKALYAHIITEEMEHVEELKNLKTLYNKDSKIKDTFNRKKEFVETYKGYTISKIPNLMGKWDQPDLGFFIDGYFVSGEGIDKNTSDFPHQSLDKARKTIDTLIKRGKLRELDSIDDAYYGPNDNVLTKEDAIKELKSARIVSGDYWDAGEPKLGYYVQIQAPGMATHEEITKYPRVSPRESSYAWGRIWKDDKFLKEFKGQLNVVRQDMIRYLMSIRDSVKDAKNYTFTVHYKNGDVKKETYSGDYHKILKQILMRKDVDSVDDIDNDSVEDSIKDVNPREGESRDDFISRFMKETEAEYPDKKQRLAVAFSYWKKKNKDSVKDDYSGFLGNYGFDYLKGSGDYEYWYFINDYLTMREYVTAFQKAVQRIRKEYPDLIISSSSDDKERLYIYIQKSKYKKDSIKDSYYKIPKGTTLKFLNACDFGKNIPLIGGVKEYTFDKDISFMSKKELREFATEELHKKYKSDKRSRWILESLSQLDKFEVKDSVKDKHYGIVIKHYHRGFIIGCEKATEESNAYHYFVYRNEADFQNNKWLRIFDKYEQAVQYINKFNLGDSYQEKIVNGYVIGKNAYGRYTVYNNQGHFEEDKNECYKTEEEAIKRAKSLKKGIAIEWEDSVKDIEFKYLSEEAKKLKEELGLYKQQIGSHKYKPKGENFPREIQNRRNQYNDKTVKEFNESINQAIDYLSKGETSSLAWNRLSQHLDEYKSNLEYGYLFIKANNAIKKFVNYINSKEGGR